MSRFVVDLTDPNPQNVPSAGTGGGSSFGPSIFDAEPPVKKRRRWLKVLAILFVLFALFVGAAGIGGYMYWRSLKNTPQYSLALLVDAAKNDDKKAIDELVDFDAVVDDFVPQVTGKATELYGKGLPPKIIAQLAKVAIPVMPAIKERARAELPRIVRERVEKLGNVPFVAMVVGAGRYLDIRVDGDNATVTSKIPERPLEVKMRRNGDRWQIVGVKDDVLATEIAKKIGQDIIAIATNGGAKKTAEKLGVGSLADLLRKAGDLIK